jgi:hypothetical protein
MLKLTLLSECYYFLYLFINWMVFHTKRGLLFYEICIVLKIRVGGLIFAQLSVLSVMIHYKECKNDFKRKEFENYLSQCKQFSHLGNSIYTVDSL